MRDDQAAQKLQHLQIAEDEAKIRTTLITRVENNVPLNIDPQREPERFAVYREMFFQICRCPGFGNERAMKWMAWGTHAGFTII